MDTDLFLTKLIEPDPELRYSPEEAYTHLHDLCSKYKLIKTKKSKITKKSSPKISSKDMKVFSNTITRKKLLSPTYIGNNIEECNQKYTKGELISFAKYLGIKTKQIKKDICTDLFIIKDMKDDKLTREELLKYFMKNSDLCEKNETKGGIDINKLKTIALVYDIKESSRQKICEALHLIVKHTIDKIYLSECEKSEGDLGPPLSYLQYIGKTIGIKSRNRKGLCKELKTKKKDCFYIDKYTK